MPLWEVDLCDSVDYFFCRVSYDGKESRKCVCTDVMISIENIAFRSN